ncbi:receptor-like protein kinase 7 [Amaranthus tricolor]|uniref:receptor-like protein kinase 7 n=1 Tax=Amaranthus tricolor TaxID=29722 RepID=UPI002582E8C1|nr:receptor-like protein kinase 7 [Amaranthus tricolor]
MASKIPSFFLLFLFLCSFGFASSDELNSLLTLKSSLQSTNPNLFSSWISSKPTCEFPGISCNSAGNITEIDLSKQGLSGTLPFNAICSLSFLQKLSFGFNSITGNVTVHLRNCTNLQYLDLGNNLFSGSFPDISSLNKLKYLYLNSSGFSGKFPWKSLNNMTGLIQLSLGDNPFEISPFPKQITQLRELNWLYLTNCSISGSIPPEIGNLNQLINLELSINFLIGSIPSEISNLTNLWQLELYGNQLTGKIPTGFRNLTKLQRFDASNNSLEGDLSELKFMYQLVWIQLYLNKLTGEIPAEFGEFKNLVNLSLYSNNLTGELPQKLGSWAEFNFIDVSTNSLSGTIPPDMCKKGTMKKLLILQNKFSGEIPASYGNCTTLTRFRVSENSLTGEIPAGIWGLPNVNIIDIADNQFHGSITSDVGKAKNLNQIYASNNKLSGEIPAEIGDASSLLWIDLSNNELIGEIPESVGNLEKLNNLYLQGNHLSGNVPASLGDCLRLNDVNLARNSISGEIPAVLGSLPALNSLNLSHNDLSGLIPDTLSSLKLSLLDLSYNELSGEIPKSLSIEAFRGSLVGNAGLCSSRFKGFRSCSLRHRDYHAFIICLVLGLVILVSLSGYYLYTKIRGDRKSEKRALYLRDDDSWNMKSYHVVTFTEEEILESIKPENLIGKGGCGSVYKVGLKDGKELAVKHISNHDFSHDWKKNRPSTPMLDKKCGRSRKMKEFDMEVQTLSSIRHINVVKLFCSITSEDSSLLVYEYLPNRSLWDRLHTSKKLGLDWQTRYEIALGAARGLEYLHHGYDKPIIHRDVKSSNILLDEFLKPRIADFGLAKVVQVSSARDSTHVIAGTHGYIAPEYGYTYKVNEKSDVYSFGVVLMELVTGKKPIESEFGESKDIVSWVSSKLKNRESVLSIIDSSILEPMQEEAIKLLKIAILCTANLPELRPTMRSVVQMLEDAEPCKLVSIIVAKDGSTKTIEAEKSNYKP